MVFAVNSLLYLNQSVPPYGVALNSIANTSTSFPLSEFLTPKFFLLNVLLHLLNSSAVGTGTAQCIRPLASGPETFHILSLSPTWRNEFD